MKLNIQKFGGRGASSSNKITTGNYKYIEQGANLSIKVLDVNDNKILARISGTGPNGSFFDGTPREIQTNSPVAKGMVKSQNTIEKHTIQYFKDRGTEIKVSVPKGYKKLTGATTAPNGYEWYFNGKSRFGGEYKAILVKQKRK